jgi:hydantoinase/carbamoylase family amidase
MTVRDHDREVTMTLDTTPRLDIHGTIEALAAINRTPDLGGITREVYTPEYGDALELTARFMTERGLETRIDPAGNLIGRWEGTDPTLPRVLTGSHVDTTLNAGRYDGVVGVLGGVEAVAGLVAAGQAPRRTIEVIAFAGEEPRFGAGCIGSQLMAGRLSRADLDRLTDRDGVTVTEAMRAAGLEPDDAENARVPAAEIHAIVELHIEQGARLERQGCGLGVVTAIAAAHDLQITLHGEARHAGATPMGQRHDASLGAAELALAVERIALAARSGTTVGTVGMLEIAPGARERHSRDGVARRRRP